MSIDNLLLFILVSVLQVGSPGPSTMLVINNSINYGWWLAIISLTGDLVGIVILGVLSALGVGTLLQSHQIVYTTMRLAGALYLLWLGFKYWSRVTINYSQTDEDLIHKKQFDLRGNWTNSLFLSLTNPKAIVFFTAFFPTFIDQSGDVRTQFMVLIFGFVLVKFSVLGFYAYISDRVKGFMRSESGQLIFNRLSGFVMAAFGVSIILSSF